MRFQWNLYYIHVRKRGMGDSDRVMFLFGRYSLSIDDRFSKITRVTDIKSLFCFF